MAITDILTRIDDDAAAEAAALIGQAQAEAEALRARAEATLRSERERVLADARGEAEREQARMLAAARLAARDSLLVQKRALADEVLGHALEALETLPDAEYLDLIAGATVRAASGGEVLAIAPADARRLGGLVDRLRERGLGVTFDSAPAPLQHGVLLSRDRTRTEVSPAAMIADHRDELLVVAVRALFGERE